MGNIYTIRLNKSLLKLNSEGYAVTDFAMEFGISVEELNEILKD